MAKKTSKRKTLNILDKNKKHSQFDYTEIFRHIRTNIEFSTVDKDIKSICITSSQANEAKTTLSINLAYIFATKYNRVLLIDCDLRKNTLRSRRILVFFVGFSAFCFSAMTQMSMSMDDLASESFSWMIISIGLILAFMTLLMSLTSVVKANTKTIAMMKVFGYSEKECSHSILGCYRPVSYIGFAIGTAYQYFLLRIMVDVVFADFENMSEYGFDYKALAISLVTFVAAYEFILYFYSRKIGKLPVKSIMLE